MTGPAHRSDRKAAAARRRWSRPACGAVRGAAWSARPMPRCRSTTGSAATTGFGGTTQVADSGARSGARPHDHGAVRRQCRARPAVEVRARAERDRGPDRRGRRPSTTRSSTRRRARPSGRRPTMSRRRRSAPISSKINCFCFTEQRLKPGENARDDGRVLRRSGDSSKDREQDGLNTITLSYTFYPARASRSAAVADSAPLRTGRSCTNDPEKRRPVRASSCANDRRRRRRWPTPTPSHITTTTWSIRARGRRSARSRPSSWRSARSPGCTTCSPAAPLVFGVGVLGVLYTMHRLVARCDPRSASTRAITPAWCRSRTATA